MSNLAENNAFHSLHPFTLPTSGSVVISPITDIAYEIGEEIARGNFSYVYACTDEWQHDQVAKVLKPIGDWEQTEAKALGETVCMAISRCPHIVHVYDHFVLRGANIIITERCDVTVKALLASKDFRPEVWFRPMAKAVLNALHWMHVNELVHCDLHAGNVYVRFTPDAIMPKDRWATTFKVGDLGLARPLSALRPEGTFMNGWRPPEAIDETYGPIDHRADIYQTGLLLLSVLVGHEVEFSFDDILSGRPKDLAAGLPSPWGPVVSTFLRRTVDARPSTALDAWRSMAGVAGHS